MTSNTNHLLFEYLQACVVLFGLFLFFYLVVDDE